jgi:hypothetical protein
MRQVSDLVYEMHRLADHGDVVAFKIGRQQRPGYLSDGGATTSSLRPASSNARGRRL